MTKLLTTGEIAKRLGVPVHRVECLVEARQIEAAGRAGIAKVFSDDQFAAIAEELRKIDAERDPPAAMGTVPLP